jgi:hypothetical protein
MVLSVILLVAGFVVYGKLLQRRLMHAYELDRAPTSVASISFPMCFHSVTCSMLNRMRSTMQLATRNFSRSHDAVIRVYGDADNVIETHEQFLFVPIVKSATKVA